MREYALSDERGNVYCAFCAWTVNCASAATFEMMEFRAKEHLLKAHGKVVMFRRDNETGAIREII